MKAIIAALAVLAVASTAANAADCKSITDPQARLACFDKATKAPPKAKKAHVDDYGAAKEAMARKLNDPTSAQWRDLFTVKTPDLGEVVCGMVNSKNRMGGYVGFTGFIYEKNIRRATMMFSGREDPDYSGAAAASYCVYCASDARGDRNIESHCPSLIKAYRR